MTLKTDNPDPLAGVVINTKPLKSDLLGTVSSFNFGSLLEGNSDQRQIQYPPRPIVDIAKDMDSLIGVEDALEHFKLICAARIENQKNNVLDLKNTHAMFAGASGVGKTIMARLYAEGLFALSLQQSNQFVEVNGGDLIAGFTGQTRGIVVEKFEEAKGGILFIDEAYAIANNAKGSQGRSFAGDAIDTLITLMENDTSGTMVVFAGYASTLESLFELNMGLRSRIMHHVPFTEFNNDQLLEIFNLMCDQNGIKVHQDALPIMMDGLNAIKELSGDSFGNARDVRNIVDHLCSKASLKLFNASGTMETFFESVQNFDPNTSSLKILTAEDVSEVMDMALKNLDNNSELQQTYAQAPGFKLNG
jgi:SpoVK/Ycf46/Vps4 family AAA+-type ATPase